MCIHREDEFRNRYEVTRKMEDHRQQNALISYQIDHNLVDVLVIDQRSESCRTQSGMVRPWLTLCIDSRSRVVMAAIFSYDRPDRHTVAAAIREAILLSEEKPYGGIPHEIRVDNGYELLSHHVHQLTQELHIMLLPCTPHQPQQKGIVERFFGTLNTRLWSDQPGYVGSNTVERDPHAKATLTLQELEERFWHFIGQYHQEIHSETHEAPLEYWLTRCYAEPADPRQLDVLLQEPATRKIIKVGIVYEKRVYWHDALAPLVGTRVLVRAEPHYRGAPDTIEVFLEDQWLCTASATDSPQGQAVTSEDMMHAKHEQKAILRHAINEAKEAAKTADQAIADLSQKDGTHSPSPTRRRTSAQQETESPAQPPSEQPSASADAARPRDVLDVMAEQVFRSQEESHE